MQSGITASTELHAAFQTLLQTPTQRGLLATISRAPESLVPGATVASSSPSFAADLAALDAHLSTDAAAYVILKQDAGKCVAVTFVPDAAPVRQKMLFASTRLTLVRELGTEHFASTLFATTKQELTAEGWAKHEAHGSLAAPLTEEERNLEGIKEAEAQESMGTATRRGGHVISGGVSMPITEEALEALKKLKAGGVALVQLSIDIKTETISLVSTSSTSEASPSSIQTLISNTSPRYSFYSHSPADSSTPKVVFMYTCPAGCSVKERMIYASSSRSAVAVASSEAGIEVVKKIEASSPDELTEDTILEDIEPAKRNTLAAGGSGAGFSRPKRPGRR